MSKQSAVQPELQNLVDDYYALGKMMDTQRMEISKWSAKLSEIKSTLEELTAKHGQPVPDILNATLDSIRAHSIEQSLLQDQIHHFRDMQLKAAAKLHQADSYYGKLDLERFHAQRSVWFFVYEQKIKELNELELMKDLKALMPVCGEIDAALCYRTIAAVIPNSNESISARYGNFPI